MLEINTRLIPERFQQASLFSKIGIFSSIGVGLINLILFFLVSNISDVATAILVAWAVRVVEIIDMLLAVIILVFMARAFNNLAHFFQTKYGKENMESSLGGAPLWAPFIAIVAMFVIPKVVSPKPYINEPISAQKKTLQMIFSGFIVAGLGNVYLSNSDTFILAILGQIIIPAVYVLIYFRSKQYFIFVNNQISANPTAYSINGYAQPPTNPYNPPTQQVPPTNLYSQPVATEPPAYIQPVAAPEVPAQVEPAEPQAPVQPTLPTPPITPTAPTNQLPPAPPMRGLPPAPFHKP